MTRNRYLALFGGAAVLGISSLGFADTTPTQTDMAAELKSLRAEVAQMKAGQNESWLDQRRADEVKQLVREVLNDADTRASLQGSSAVAGYNKGFFLASEDGSFLLKIGGRIQVRYVANIRENDHEAATQVDEVEEGFQIRRVKPFFAGTIGSPKFGYRIQLAADRNTNAMGVEEAWVDYKVTDELVVMAGRFKPAFARDENTSSGKQLAVERSAVNEFFNLGYSEGIQATWTCGNIRLAAGVNDGIRAGEIGGTNDFQNDSTDIAFNARAEYKIMGDWKQFEDYNAWSGEETGLLVGAAIQYDKDERGDAGAGDTDRLMWTADLGFETGGFNAFGAVYGLHNVTSHSTATGGSATVPDSDSYGFLFQTGYFIIPDKFEPFARYEYIMADSTLDAGAFDPLSIITVGANYYFKKHDAKLTVDVSWALDPVTANNIGGTAGGTHSGLGYQTDAATKENQVVVRAQFQLQF